MSSIDISTLAKIHTKFYACRRIDRVECTKEPVSVAEAIRWLTPLRAYGYWISERMLLTPFQARWKWLLHHPFIPGSGIWWAEWSFNGKK